jgi:transcriptional regulator with XRE-family HTH domain
MARQPVDASEVKRLYTEERLTLQEIADRKGVSKQRIHQILQEEGVDTGHGAVPRPKPPRPDKDEKLKYRAYQMTERTQELVELLHAATKDTRAAVVTRAIVELADRLLPDGRDTRLADGERTNGDGEAAGDGDGQAGAKKSRRRAAATAPPDAPAADAGTGAKQGAGRRAKKKGS